MEVKIIVFIEHRKDSIESINIRSNIRLSIIFLISFYKLICATARPVGNKWIAANGFTSLLLSII